MIGTLSWCDRFELVLSSLDPLLDGEATLRVAMASYARSWPSLWTGRVAQAAEDARRAVDLWTAGAETYLPAAAFWLVSALCEMSQTQRAAGALTEIDIERWEGTAFYGFILAAQGRLAVAEGDFRTGLQAWTACGAYVTDAMHLKNPTLLPWRSEAVIAAARLQELRDRAVAGARRRGVRRRLRRSQGTRRRASRTGRGPGWSRGHRLPGALDLGPRRLGGGAGARTCAGRSRRCAQTRRQRSSCARAAARGTAGGAELRRSDAGRSRDRGASRVGGARGHARGRGPPDPQRAAGCPAGRTGVDQP